jgi:hypothetical protein
MKALRTAIGGGTLDAFRTAFNAEQEAGVDGQDHADD